jgi:hypothetical protein
MNITARRASLLMIATLLPLTSLPAIAYRYSEADCDGGCASSGGILDAIVFVVIMVFVFFLGEPRTKVFIAIWLGTPLAVSVITGNAPWAFLTYVPSLFLAFRFAEPIAKHFGWENDKAEAGIQYVEKRAIQLRSSPPNRLSATDQFLAAGGKVAKPPAVAKSLSTAGSAIPAADKTREKFAVTGSKIAFATISSLFKGVVITCRQNAEGPYWSRVFPVGPVLSELESLDSQARQYKEISELSDALKRYSVAILNKLSAKDVRPIGEAIETELPIATSAAMSRSGLERSKIVFVNFHLSAIVQPAKPTPEPTNQSGSASSQRLESAHQSTTTKVSVDEDAIYTAIFNELENRTYDRGLWTGLFAECSGDETKTKVLYIKSRAKILMNNEIAKPISNTRQEVSRHEQELNRRSPDAQQNTSERDSMLSDFQDRGWKISHDGIKWTLSKGQLSHNAWTAEDIKRFWFSNKQN